MVSKRPREDARAGSGVRKGHHSEGEAMTEQPPNDLGHQAPATLDELRIELAEILNRLNELPADAFKERIRLRDRQAELRALSRTLAVSQTSQEDLLEELADLERQRKALIDQHLNLAHTGGATGAGGGGGGAGVDIHQALEMNRAIDRSGSRGAIEARIQAIKAEVRRRTEAERSPPGMET
jgi:hypothetical protein